MIIDTALLIVITYLCITFAIRLTEKHGITTFKKFAIGEKNFKTSTLAAILIATTVGGSFLFRSLEQIYKNGLIFISFLISDVLSSLFFAEFMAPRMQEFLPHLSVAESMGSLFGKKVRIITAIFGILNTTAIVMQFQVINKIIRLIFNIENHISLYIVIALVLIYSIIGGIEAVVFTDIIHNITFGTLLPILIYLSYTYVTTPNPITTVVMTYETSNLKKEAAKFIYSVSSTLMSIIPGWGQLLSKGYICDTQCMANKTYI